MSDTIDLLEAIGKNASLRHASGQELADSLERADASEALKAAAMTGDSSLLCAELGHKPMIVNHDVHAGWKEDENEEDLDPGKTDPDPSPEPDKG
ncbi:MAG TPA: hypothetical protein VGO76_01915 [Luteibacter sp.]|jgi:hypothetical protein|nr:hypothetical protein [Luteibacter sp.]